MAEAVTRCSCCDVCGDMAARGKLRCRGCDVRLRREVLEDAAGRVPTSSAVERVLEEMDGMETTDVIAAVLRAMAAEVAGEVTA